jgi:hypothetical protein
LSFGLSVSAECGFIGGGRASSFARDETEAISVAKRSFSTAPRQSSVSPSAQAATAPSAAAGAIAETGVIAGAGPESNGVEL